MEDLSEFMMYEMKFVSNVAGVGSFTCVPAKEMSIQQVLDYLKAHPNDQFMHKYLLFTLAKYDKKSLKARWLLYGIHCHFLTPSNPQRIVSLWQENAKQDTAGNPRNLPLFPLNVF